MAPMTAWILSCVSCFGDLVVDKKNKKRYQHGTLVSGNMDQNLRNPSCLILSHTHLKATASDVWAAWTWFLSEHMFAFLTLATDYVAVRLEISQTL